MLGFPKTMVEKLLILSFGSPLRWLNTVFDTYVSFTFFSKESAVIFAAYDVSYRETHARAPHIEAVSWLMSVVNIEFAKKQQNNEENIHSSTCSSWLPDLCSLHHTSQRAADLVFEPALKRPKKREKPNFERNFLAENRKREEITPQT